MRILILWIALGLSHISLLALDTTTVRRIAVTARPHADSVVLRWGTSDAASWRLGIEKGYNIVRYNVDPSTGRVDEATRTVLTPTALRPLTINQFKERFNPTDTFAGAAVQVTHGSSIVRSTSPLGALQEQATQESVMHGYALYIADIRPDLANAMALRFVDRSPKAKTVHYYEVSLSAQDADIPVEEGFTIVSARSEYSIQPHTDLEVEEEDGAITLHWQVGSSQTPYSAYHIETSSGIGKAWTRITNRPHVHIANPDIPEASDRAKASFTVRPVPNGEARLYRLLGITAFGELSPPSNTVTAMGRDKTGPPVVAINQPKAIDDTSMRITWSAAQVVPDLAGIVVSRAPNDEGPFEDVSPLLPNTATEFIDRSPLPGGTYYYTVSTIDTAGNRTPSIAMFGVFPDSIPPQPVTGFRGTIDSVGTVTLTWDASTAPDIRGYRVFYANAPDHEFMPITGRVITDTMLVDTVTLKTLSEDIWYRVTALDMNYNGSDFAQIKLTKPDTVSPATGDIVHIRASERTIVVTWRPSPTADVVTTYLLRKTGSVVDTVARVSGAGSGEVITTDSLVKNDVMAEYYILAVDDAGLYSLESEHIESRRVPASNLDAVRDVTITWDESAKAVILSWVPTGGGPSTISVYRSRSSNSGPLVATVPDSDGKYADTDVSRGQQLWYAVKRTAETGAESEVSATLSIQVPAAP